MPNYPVDDLMEEPCDFNHEESLRYRTPVVNINICSMSFLSLIDSGSECSCLSYEAYQQISSYLTDVPIVPVQGIRITGAFKAKQQRVLYQILLPFTLGSLTYNFEFLVIENLIYPCIIGIDLLRTLKAKIDLPNNCLWLQHDESKICIPEVHPRHDYQPPPVSCGIRVCSTNHHIPETPPAGRESDDLEDCIASTCLDAEQQVRFRQLLNRHKHIFSDKPGLTTMYQHSIKLRDPTPFNIRPYPIAIAHRGAVRKEIQRMLDWGVIERANTPYCSPLMATTKKDGSVRVCLDFRHANQVMEPDFESPKPIEDLLRTLGNVNYMSSVDLTCSYWQIPIREEDRQYTGFKYENQVYQFKVLPFGLSTSVASFSRALSFVLGPYFDSFTNIYVDDLLVTSTTFDDHLRHLDLLFTRLAEAGFTLRLNKCSFFQQELKFLGYVLNASGLRPDPQRIQAIEEFPIPSKVPQLQAFLGLCNFDRSFTEEFAVTTAPLTKLLRKNVPWSWQEEQQMAFDKLKAILCRDTMLYHPRFDQTFYVQTDACAVGVGAELFQIICGKHRTVAFASRILLDRETRYASVELEMLAIVFALQKWRTFLLGRQFVIYTDNKAITYINSCRLLSPRITRWCLALQEFSFMMKHVPGKENVVPDILSRHPSSRQVTPTDKTFRVLAIKREDDVFKQLRNSLPEDQLQDPRLSLEIEKLKKEPDVKARYILHNDILFLQVAADQSPLVCIPEKNINDVINAYHVSIGHFGVYKTWAALRKDLWFPNLHRRVKGILKNCQLCQSAKLTPAPSPSFEAIIPEEKGDLLSVDYFGPLPKSRGGATYLFVCIDVYTKYVTLYPLRRATTKSSLDKILNDYVPRLGPVKRILSDRGTQFTSKVWRNTLEKEGIKVQLTSVRRPQGSPVERVMKELGRLCRTYCHRQHKRWAFEVTNFANFINSVVHESTGMTPSEAHLGIIPKYPLRMYIDFPEHLSYDSHVKLYLARDILLKKARKRELKHPGRDFVPFKKDDLVLLRANPISQAQNEITKKFMLLYEGPYIISEVVATKTYRLSFRETGRERGIFHAAHLKLFSCENDLSSITQDRGKCTEI